MERCVDTVLPESLYRTSWKCASSVSSALLRPSKNVGAASIVSDLSRYRRATPAEMLSRELNLTLYHEILILILQVLVAGAKCHTYILFYRLIVGFQLS